MELAEDELPFDAEAEKFVCGAVLSNSDIYSEVAARVTTSDFYIGRYRQLWAAIRENCESIGYVDIAIMRTFLKATDKLDLFDEALSAQMHAQSSLQIDVSAVYHATVVRERSLQRQLLQLKNQISAETFRKSPADVLIQIRSVVEELTGKLPQSVVDTIASIKERVLHNIKQRFAGGGELQGISTGLNDLDALCSGFRPGQLILIGARPGMGKTQLALNLLWAGLRKPEPEIVPTVFFTLEMSKDEIIERLLAQLGDMPFHFIKTGKIYDENYVWAQDKLSKGIEKLDKLRLTLFDETDNVNTVPKLEARIRALPEPPKLIVIDYLSYLKDTRKEFSHNKTLEVAEIAMDLKRLAVRLNIPVVVLSQLNRELEKRQDKRPILADFRDSGGIEQAADLAMMIYREHMYNRQVDQDWLTELIIAKQRNGSTGTVFVGFNQNTGIFYDLAESQQVESENFVYTVGGEAINATTSISVRKGNKKRGSTAAAHTQRED